MTAKEFYLKRGKEILGYGYSDVALKSEAAGEVMDEYTNSKLNKIIKELEIFACFEGKPEYEYEQGWEGFAKRAIETIKKEITKKN